MATISSHVLDSVIGTHAAGIRIACFQRDTSGNTTLVFDKLADEQGRIKESVQWSASEPQAGYELVFHSAEYYGALQLPDDGYQIMRTVVLRLDLPDAKANYHVPLMLSPHSYSVWWSGVDPSSP